MMPTLDHLVYAVPDLARACAAFAKTTSVTPAPGGQHPGRGTHNALVGLAGGAYLEFIAADPTQPTPEHGRWMGVDLVTAPTLTRWAIRDVDLGAFAKTLRAHRPALAHLTEGSRRTAAGQTLAWRMTEPQPAPAVELVPFALDWTHSETHPTEGLTPTLELLELRLEHPGAEALNQLFRDLGLAHAVYSAASHRLGAHLATPRGNLWL